MKKHLLLLPLLALGCQKNDPAAEEEFEVQTLGRSMDCGQPLVEVMSKHERVAELVGVSTIWVRFVASNLDTALWQSKSQRLLIKVRKPLASEVPICHHMGPTFPNLVVTSARVQPQ